MPLTFGMTVDLGWDPTMQLKYDDQLSSFCYEMTVTPVNNPVRKYRSVKILSKFSADAIQGCTTQVFKVYEINEHGQRVQGSKNVTIKDYWLDSSHEAEPIILKKILEATDETMKAKFLTILMWGNLFVNGDVDSTDRIMNSLGLHLEAGGYKDSDHPTPLKFYLCQYEPKQPLKCSAAGLAHSTRPTSHLSPSVVQFDAKMHQRIVFKEVGCPIHDEESIKTIFKAAQDATEGQL